MRNSSPESVLERTVSITNEIQQLQNDISALGDERRRAWLELSRVGVTQPQMAQHCGVAIHTVYMQIRRARENE